MVRLNDHLSAASTLAASPAPRVLLEALRAAADAGDWAEVERRCHPESRLVLRVSDGRALPLDEALEVLRADAEAGEPEPTHYYVDDLDDRAAIALGSVVRKGVPRELCWLLTFMDGLVYRQGVYESLGEAQAAYAKFGIDLGHVDVSDPSASS